MKRFLSLLFGLSVLSFSAAARERGAMWLGPKAGVYANTGGYVVVGIGAEFRYGLSERVRVAPSAVWLANEGCSVEFACDVQYVLRVAQHWHVYPSAGVSFNDIGSWAAGVDLGLGMDYAVGRRTDLTAGFKWMPMCGREKNPLAVFAGLSFRL